MIGALLLLTSAPVVSAQKRPLASMQRPAMPMQRPAMPVQRPAMPAPIAPQPQPLPRQRVVIVEPVRVFDPFFYDPFFYYPYPYTYPYPVDYMSEHFGYVKIKTELKDAKVYVDGGFANRIEKAKKFALRPGNHDIELRDSDGRTLFKERVAVLVGKTTELKVG
jgi:hypothetical protein